MTQGWQRFVTAGQRIRGVCYASPTDFVGCSTGLAAIPPERVGLHGEYDYYGLAKRIQARCQEHLGLAVAAKILIEQRGSTLVLSGCLDSRAQLEDLIALAMTTEGTTKVEIYDMQISAGDSLPCQALQVA
ncbi:MAG TPA: BON domain-containing protein [Leptolyngbyaceae cyanobacterium M65_K2018_010]|nr:BON domain-containing protein [Leptolyngbyaceae cyanobacterium M65_K2018_010]